MSWLGSSLAAQAPDCSQQTRSRLEILLTSTFETCESSDGTHDGALSYAAARLVSLDVVCTRSAMHLQANDRSGSSRAYRERFVEEAGMYKAGVAYSIFMR